MVIVEGTYPIIGDVIWVWSEDIGHSEDRHGHRHFYITTHLHIKLRFEEVPLSVHQGELVGLMIPKVLAGLNGIHANT